jgi:glycosyltransferase EpsF
VNPESRRTVSAARDPIRVLQVIDTLGMGGAETWLMELLRYWSKIRTVQMDFLLTSGREGIFDQEARRLGAKLYYVKYSQSNVALFVREFRRILCAGRYHAIHDHADYASGWHFLIGLGLLPRVRVTHIHNPSYQILNNYAVTTRRRLVGQIGKSLVGRFATHVGGTSRQIITEYGFDGRRFRHIPRAAVYCGFDPGRFNGDATCAKQSVCREFGWPEDAKIILSVGRIDHSPMLGDPQNHKNSGFAVSIGMECLRQNSNVRMLLAGAASPAVPILQRRIAAAGASGQILFLGIRRDIERLMLGSDVLLFPSVGEGLGMAAVEVQAAGLPVLASTAVPRECVVVPELVRFESLERSPTEWAAVLFEHVLRPRAVAAANKRVAASPFAIENSARALLEIYKQGVWF